MTMTAEIGKRIKQRRKILRMSLRELAEATGVTASFLSQLERGITNASLTSLQKISDALNVPMLYFLSESRSDSPVVRAGKRPMIDLDDERVGYELLTPDLTGEFEAIIGRIHSSCENVARPLSVETEEFIFVLEGSLVVGLKDQNYSLKAGDSMSFKGSDLVSLRSDCEEETRWMSVITPPVF